MIGANVPVTRPGAGSGTGQTPTAPRAGFVGLGWCRTGPNAAAVRRFDIIYCEYQGDIVDSFNKWKSGTENPSSVVATYSSQFFEFAAQLGARTYALSGCARRDRAAADGLVVVHHPRRTRYLRFVGYHLEQLRYALLLYRLALVHRPKAIYVDSGVTHRILLAPIRLFGIRVVAVMHNALWPNGFPPSGWSMRLLLLGDKLFFRHVADATFCVSPVVERQVRSLIGDRTRRTIQFRPAFRRHPAATATGPHHGERPFRVLFAGRIERNKGVFDLADAAFQLQRETPGAYRFEYCGDGSDSAALAERICALGLSPIVAMNGRLGRDALVEAYQRTHVVVVPTRSDFCEGYAQVVAEAVLLGRPVITNRVVPAFEDLEEAIVEATADDPGSLARSIRSLSEDRALFEAKSRACGALADRILDTEASSYFARLTAHRDLVGVEPRPVDPSA